MAKKKISAKSAKTKKASPKRRKRKLAPKIEIPKSLAIAEIATRHVEQRNDAMVKVQGAHNDEYQDDNQTSRKRRRTSGQAFTDAGREEQNRAASMEVTANKDVRERIRTPHRSPNQNRSR